MRRQIDKDSVYFHVDIHLRILLRNINGETTQSAFDTKFRQDEVFGLPTNGDCIVADLAITERECVRGACEVGSGERQTHLAKHLEQRNDLVDIFRGHIHLHLTFQGSGSNTDIKIKSDIDDLVIQRQVGMREVDGRRHLLTRGEVLPFKGEVARESTGSAVFNAGSRYSNVGDDRNRMFQRCIDVKPGVLVNA